MKSSLDKLQKFFKLESERGYDNRAVVGGLEQMLSPWEAEARAEGVPEDLVQAVLSRLRDYPNLSPTSRAEALEGLWRRIQRESGQSASALTPPPPAEPTTDQRAPKPTNQRESRFTPSGAPPHSGTTPQSRPTRQSRPTPIVEGSGAVLESPITVLKGVGPRHGQTLSRLGLVTLGDMLYFFPRRYDDYSLLKPINRLTYGEEVTVIGFVDRVSIRPIRGGKAQIAEAIISDGSGALRITWFNQPWIAKRLRPGMYVSLAGKIEQYLGRFTMNNPDVEPIDQENLHTHRIIPVYPLTANITQRWLRNLMHEVVSYWAPRVQDPLPNSIRDEYHLINLAQALLQAHFPDGWDQLQASRQRLGFDEIFLLQLGVLRQKRAWQERAARVYPVHEQSLENLINRLPFTLTGAQQRALADLEADLTSGKPMNRLLQGDVGSGKTIVAAMAIAIVAHHGVQSALMAPTSILAEQHYRSLINYLSVADNQDGLRPEEICLLIGATPESQKQEIREGLAAGKIKVVVGTHALLEDPVNFSDLQLAIIDEQHRFGVTQRAILREKGDNLHLLVMTATPIPRSLALTVYGDLDLSILDEMPPGRQLVETQVFLPRERERAYGFIRKEVSEGRQAFIIYPLVEESEASEAKAAVEEHERLQRDIFPDYQLGLMHGRLRPEEKETVMSQFRGGDLQILVSTSVVEVGVDIPNATVLLIEGANRFGLSQLHQFRGRVGRGQDQAYCILIPDTADAIENERLSAMIATNDGFILAERDLAQRGPGQFLGTRQSGYQTELKFASLTDLPLIEKARRAAQDIFSQDPELAKAEFQILQRTLEKFWNKGQGDIS